MKKLTVEFVFVSVLIIALIYNFEFKSSSDTLTKSEFKPQGKAEQTKNKTEILKTDLITNDEPKALNKVTAENQDNYPPISIDKNILNHFDDIKRDKEYYLKKDNEIINFIKLNINNLKAVVGKKDTFEYKNDKITFRIKTYGQNSKIIDNIRSIIYINKLTAIVYFANKNFLKEDSKKINIFTERVISLSTMAEDLDDNDPIKKSGRVSPVIVNNNMAQIIVSYEKDDHDLQYIHDISTGDTKLVSAASSSIDEDFMRNNYDSSGRPIK
jgi:hypothetical protein